MVDAGDEAVDADLVLAVPAPVPRRAAGQSLSGPCPMPPVPPPVPRPPPVPSAAPPPPVIEAGAGATPAEAWPDRDALVSTGVSLFVHVVVLTVLALLVPLDEDSERPAPVEIVQAIPEQEPEPFADPEEDLPVEIVPPEPEPQAEEMLETVEEIVADDAADAAAAFAPGDAAESGLVALDPAGLMARVGGPVGDQNAGPGGLGGFGGEVGKRLARAGAKTGDIQVSLSWNNFNDLDVHVITPSGERIFFGRRRSRCQGTLDVDMNASGPVTREPVENVFWPARAAPQGEYQVFVHHFARHDTADETAFDVHVLVDGTKRRFSGYVKSGDPPELVGRFKKTAKREQKRPEFVE